MARNEAAWRRLDELARRRAIDGRETDELVRLYLRASSHLATARRRYHDPALLLHLTSVVARANATVYGSRARSGRRVLRALTHTFPAALWHIRRTVVLAAAVFLVTAVASGIWIATTPAAADVALPPPVRDAYLNHDFEAYYSSQPASQFAAQVFTNNAQVGLVAFAVGIALGIPTLLVLAFNGLNVGVAAGIFHAAGGGPQFWALILPHGLLELTAVFVAGGAGLRVGWALVAPGDRSRADALADEARRAVVIVIGLVPVFLVAGLTEAFVTPSDLPTWARIGTGILIECAFLAYVGGFGRQAAALGLTGALGERERSVTAARAPSG